jgi:hypothetical protein
VKSVCRLEGLKVERFEDLTGFSVQRWRERCDVEEEKAK